MMAETASWDDWSTSETHILGEEDKWHVALAPGEVKIVSLEQLDDLFRLSIVDAETKVWQNGMSEWRPLGLIAGLDTDPEPQLARPKPPAPRSAPPPPRPAVSTNRAPASPESLFAQPLALASTRPTSAPVVNQFSSLRPLVVSQPPRPVPRGAGGFGRFLVGLALIAGVSVTLYRNDVVRDAAQSLHRDQLYARLQALLGGPAFGTLASIEQSTSKATQLAGSAVSRIAPDVQETQSAAAQPIPAHGPVPVKVGGAPPIVSLESLNPAPPGSAQPDAVTARPASPVGVVKPAASTKPSTGTAASTFKAVPVKPEPAAKTASVRKKTSEKAEADMTPRERLDGAISTSVMSSSSASKTSKKASKANEYDPLNPTL